jgi:hypothetical protein
LATIDKYLKVRKGVDAPDVLTSSATIYDYLKTPVVYFDTASPALGAIGGLVWDDGEGTLSLGLKGGNVNLQVGQENVALCYNGTASTIPNGSVVYISSAQGQRPSIALATAATEQGSSKVFGITTEDISVGAEGFVATFGIVNKINTLGFTEGAALWLSASAGKLTQTKPISPNHLVFVGYCLKVNSNSGRIFVNPQNGYELEELHDVLITSASNNNIISYNAASGLWVNKNILDAIKEVDGTSSGLDADLLDGQHGSYYAPVASPSFTGTPLAPTAASTTNNTQIATTAFVRTQVSALVDAAPSTLDTLNELAAALGDDPNFATTVTNSLATKLDAGTASTLYLPISGSVNWSNINNKPGPVITLGGDLSGSVTLTDLTSHTLNATIVANSVALGTDTTGNYVAGITAGNGVSITGTAGEGWSPTVAINSLTASVTFANIISKPTTLSGYGITDAAPLASPALTGIPTAPTASVGTNTTQIATTAFVYSMITGIDGGTPSSTYEFSIDGGGAS